jgi:hypothetical protein
LNRRLSAVGALVGAAALVTSTFLIAAPAAQADTDTGTLVVNVVDQYGRPTPGTIYLVDSDGSTTSPTGPIASGSQTFTAIPSGGYAMAIMTPWSGLTCLGTATCGMTAPTFGTAVTTVPSDGSTVAYTAHVTVPSVTGTGAVGSQLTVNIPQGLTDLLNLYSNSLSYAAGTVSAQWVRGTSDIPGATGTTYATVRDDGANPLSARLTVTGPLGVYYASAGFPSFTTNAVAMQPAVKARTKTKLKVAKSIHHGQRVSAKIKVTSAGGTPDGFVTLSIGKFKAKKTLKNGSAFVTLPSLKAGKYKITTKYVGAKYYSTSKAKKVTVTVRG